MPRSVVKKITLSISTHEKLSSNTTFKLKLKGIEPTTVLLRCELQSPTRASGYNAGAGRYSLYSLQHYTSTKGNHRTTLYFNNVMRTQEDYPTRWKEVIIRTHFWSPEKIPRKQKTILYVLTQYTSILYRPILLICCLRLLLEMMTNSRDNWWLQKDGLLTAHQCRYQKQHYTTDKLVYLGHEGQNSSIESKHMAAVFFDFEK